MPVPKQYLGDGIYAEHDGYQLWLTTDNGIEETSRIALDPGVWAALVKYVADLEKQAARLETWKA